MKSLHAGIRTQVLAGISSGFSVNEVKDSVTEYQPKEVYRNHAFSVGNDSSFSSEYRRTRNKLFCVIINNQWEGWGVELSRSVVWVGFSRRVARVGERVLSCMGEWVRLLHS